MTPADKDALETLETMLGIPQPVECLAKSLIDTCKLGGFKFVSRHPTDEHLFYLMDLDTMEQIKHLKNLLDLVVEDDLQGRGWGTK